MGKAFFDQMGSVSLSDMMELMGAVNQELLSMEGPSLIKNMNAGQFKYQYENNSFKQMFMSEITGLVDANREANSDVMRYKYEKDTGNTLSDVDMKGSDDQLICNMIYNLFKLNKINAELPSFKIMSGFHAAVRWDKNQKFKKSDLHGFRHAAAALPYCDYFFTERSLTNLISQKLLSYDKLYNCNAQWKVKQALDCLSELDLGND